MAAYEALEPDAGEFIPHNARVETLFTGTRWGEGPVWFADTAELLWSDIPSERMLRWTESGGTSVFRSPSRFANGNTRDSAGRLVTCEHGSRSVTRTEHDGSITVLADSYDGKRLNSPNDVVAHSDGSVWFTDPTYGIRSDYEGHKAESELGRCCLFRLDGATGRLSVASDEFVMPNGLAFSPDERILYVSDTGRSNEPGGPPHIRSFTVGEAGVLSGGEVFADMHGERSDGFRVDTDGNIWTSAGDGVMCITPEGRRVLKIPFDEPVSNLTFGGPRRHRLFITAQTSLYAIFTMKNGAQRP